MPASANGYVKINIIADSKQAAAAFGQLGRAGTSFTQKMASAGRAMTLGFTAPVVAGMALSVKAASDLNEEMNKVQVVFGKSATAVVKFSKQGADALGLSQRAALAAAGAYGNMLRTAGMTEKQSASMSTTLVKLAADMASFNNIPMAEALEKIQSGLAGEAEPLRRLGVLLSEARVKQEAYSSGLAKQGKELTEQQKVLARYALILKDTSTQQGDFARTSDSLANRTRILRAKLEDLAASFGQALLPAAEQLAAALSDIMGAFNRLGDETKSAITKVAPFGAAIGPVLWGTAKLIEVVKGAAAAYKSLTIWAGAAGAAQKVANAGGLSAAGQRGAALINKGAAAQLGAAAVGSGLGAAVIPVAVVAIAAGVGIALAKANKAQSEARGGKSPGNTFGLGVDAKKAQESIQRILGRIANLKARLAEKMALGIDTSKTEKALNRAQIQLNLLRDKVKAKLVAGHIQPTKWLESIAKGDKALYAFKSHVTAGINTGPLNTSSWTDALWRAYQYYLNIKAGMAAPISSHINVTRTVNTVKAHASGGIVTTPHIGLVGESGPEAIIPLTKPARAAQVMQEAGLAGFGTINVNVVVPGGTTLIGTAREVGDILAPHVARALGREVARAGRRR